MTVWSCLVEQILALLYAFPFQMLSSIRPPCLTGIDEMRKTKWQR